jgi:hypothetical protein
LAEEGPVTGVAACLRREIVAHRRSWLAIVLGIFVGFQLFQLAGLMLRFETAPNYVTFHDWPANVARIIRSTPAVSDMIPIILDEWLIEIGSMNYSFGRGIAEWSFVLMPAKLAVVLVIAVLFATDIVLLRVARKTCSLTTQVGTSAAAAAGTLVAGAATTTITWVVCCAAPTWVVGLAVMGVSTTTALTLQPMGGSLLLLGISALAAPALLLARMLSGHARATAPSLALTPANIAGAMS